VKNNKCVASSQTAVDKIVSSLCPECLKVIQAHIFSDDDKVFIEKTCLEHGYFKDIYWSDASLYMRFNSFWSNGQGLENSLPSGLNCPFDCGICKNHLTGTLLGNIDLTGDCNMACPICFADAGRGSFNPTLEQVESMMLKLRSELPVPCPAVQFSGGEPTLRQDLPEIVAMARAMGFAQIQIATNGLRLASSLSLCQALRENGLNTVYLQFDGVTPEPYIALRGQDYLPLKLKALENLREASQTSVVLVPTLARGVNDSQVGDIIRFAARNLDVVRGINFQPVSFAGRIAYEERAKKRITIPDLLRSIEEQTGGEIAREDFYPVPVVVPISRLLEATSSSPQPIFAVHPCCGAATYIYSHGGRMIPVTRFIDVEGLMERIKREVESFDGSGLGRLKMKGMILKELPRFIDEDKAPRDLKVAKMLISVFRNGTRESLTEFHRKTLFLGAMHFQDAYNMDLERLRRCGIHYATPDGRIIPFCSYNTIHRQRVEDRFSSSS
jgi:uncharacterized radical SAM superfamily Fe-S cluster-containing enzyme